MSVSEFERSKDKQEIAKLNEHHAREIAALKLAHANDIAALKERHAKETARFQREIARLQNQPWNLAMQNAG